MTGYPNSLGINLPSPLQEVTTERTRSASISLFVKRDDLIHPFMSGNKWRKLKFTIMQFLEGEFDCLRTFGGAFSNHLYATAWAGRFFSINTVAYVRGEPESEHNPTLKFVRSQGMKLIFLDRQHYRRRDEDNFLNDLKRSHPSSLFVPEGGSNVESIRGIKELVEEIVSQQGDQAHWVVPVGSGGTLAGLIAAAPPGVTIHGIVVLKGAEYLAQVVQKLLLEATGVGQSNCDYHLYHDFHCGGYARFDPELVDFMTQYWLETGVQLEPVYSGKAMKAVYSLMDSRFIPPGSDVVFIHTGGLQGLAGLRMNHPEQFQHDAFNI